MSVPQWLAQELIDKGHHDVNGIGRNARGRRCRECGEWVIAGLDGDRCAEAAHIDPVPLSALGEMVALVGGQSTYALRREGPAFRIDHRHRWAIERTPAGMPGQRYDVCASHRCDAPEPTGPLITTSVLQRLSARTDYDSEPPY